MGSTSVLKTGSSTDPTVGIPLLHLWRFNLSIGTVTQEMLDEVPGEFPRINENLLGRKTQYACAAKMAKDSLPLFDSIIKYNLISGKSQTHKFQQRRYGGEAVFGPRFGATREDDGWLITFVSDQNLETSELVVINAQDVTSEAIGRVIIPQRVPYGFHGA
jgi:carotenoid cleavage dioxygenase